METMISESPAQPFPQRSLIHTTLLDLVWAVSQTTEDERLVVATVAHLVNSGRARLNGTFKGTTVVLV